MENSLVDSSASIGTSLSVASAAPLDSDLGASSFGSLWQYELLLVGDNSIKISNLVIAVILVIVGLRFSVVASKALKKSLEKLTSDKDALNAVHKIAFYLLFVFYVITVLEIANIPLDMFAFIGGAIAISAGLGAQQILNNLISGILIIIEKPIKIGDVIEVNGIVGRVICIGGRSTVLRQFNGTEIVVPNSTIMQKHLTNWNYDNENLYVEIEVKIEVLDQTDKAHKKVLSQIEKAAAAVKMFQKLKKAEVSLTSVSKKEDEFTLSIEIPEDKINEIAKIKTELNLALIKHLDYEFTIVYPAYLR